MRATPGNYPHKSLPEQRAQLDFGRTLDGRQYRALTKGVIPRSQEDRWFAFEVDDWFFLCRSWTGNCIFQVRLAKHDEGWAIVEAWVNRDPDQYASVNDETDARALGRLLDTIITRNTK